MGEVSLYPTKTRLALLRQVANSQVQAQYFDETQAFDEPRALLFPDVPTSWQDPRLVTARMRELQRAGWVREPELGDFGTWQVTDEGRKILEDNRG